MKTINVSDEDYKVLMDLSKELQLQDNNGQAFPYFWEPSSLKRVPNVNDEGTEITIYDYDISESYSLESYAEVKESEFEKYLNERDEVIRPYDEENDESDWLNYIRQNIHEAHIITEDWKRQTDHNPSLFMSDVQNYIEKNSHHLGRDPKTYSRSFFRMPKMISLVEAIYRINKQPVESVNEEARLFVYKKEDMKTMKCESCNGTGDNGYVGERAGPCPSCDGKKKVTIK